MIDSKVILHDICYDTYVNFFVLTPCFTLLTCVMLRTWEYTTLIYMVNVFCLRRTTIKLPTRDHIQSLSLCLLTQVHACMPYLKAVHYAQTNITFPAEIQCGPCLLLQQTHTAPTSCSSGRPVLRMLFFQSTELGRSCTWSAP